ncbi:MAG: DHA2 family efflux MFS transporter permease subunit [Legionella sp.]|uniref:DHA2 family efflux MFS transporter permease subunit n=1 Tax=Legionella sp. TaxID=459 RepID=UPI00283F439B|nr:DHA2 family efflux MFS transporter permease subunit [Legionella sp.]
MNVEAPKAVSLSESASQSERAVPIKDWIIVLTACLGAFMAVLDIQITNSSLADIQGALGATIDEGSWISTSYLIAEIIVIPLTDWLSKTFGMKQYLLANSALFVVLSCCCAFAQNLTAMIVFRAMQGFTGGVLIPLAMSIIIAKLPPSKQSIGLACFGLSATFAPAIGPSLGGWITANYGWPFIFYLNIIPGTILVVVLALTLESTKGDFSLFKNGDWLGIILMAVGLGSLETVLEEGNRKDWFGSELILRLSVIAAISLVAWLVVELKVKRPVIDLRLFAKRNFFFSGIANLTVGAGLYGPSYLTPVYLSQIHGYNAFQIGEVMMWFGIPQLILMPLVPQLMKKIDGRILIFAGLALFVVSFLLNDSLDINFAGPQLILPQIVRALGLPLIFVPLSGIAVEGIEESRMGSASALYNMTRNLGGSFGIAAIGTLLTQREKFHSYVIGESVSLFAPATQERFDYLVQSLAAKGAELNVAQNQAIAIIDGTIRREANLMAFNDCYLIYAGVLAVGCAAVMCLKKSSGAQSHGMH